MCNFVYEYPLWWILLKAPEFIKCAGKKLLFKRHFSSPRCTCRKLISETEVHCGYEYTKTSFRQIKNKMAESVRQKFPFPWRSWRDKNREEWKWCSEREPVLLCLCVWMQTTVYLLGHLLDEPFLWIVFIVQFLVRVWTREGNKSVWRGNIQQQSNLQA